MYIGIFLIWNILDDILPGVKNVQPRDLYDIMNNQVKPALGLTSDWSDSSGAVFNTLAGDFMKPVTSVGKNNKANPIKNNDIMWPPQIRPPDRNT